MIFKCDRCSDFSDSRKNIIEHGVQIHGDQRQTAPVGPTPRPLAERLRAQWQVVLADECVAANVGCYEAEQLSLVIEEAADLIERQAKVVEAARLLNSFPTINLDEYEQINAFDSVTAALSAFDDLEAE